MLDWERMWRGSGVVSAVLLIIAFVIYGSQPKLGASAVKLVSFFDGDRTSPPARQSLPCCSCA
jgi:hypothetical protein